MENFLQFSGDLNSGEESESLGKVLLEWSAKPKMSGKFWMFILSIVGGLVIFLLVYGHHFIPWLEQLPEFFIYALILLLTPLLRLITGRAKDKEITLYQHGYRIKSIGRDKSMDTDQRRWVQFKKCTYEPGKVYLYPVNSLKSRVILDTPQNTQDVYVICREYIGMAREEAKNHSVQGIQTKLTKHEQELSKFQHRVNKRHVR